jgi:dipeptidyl aminopeptidase/acylaminoacyl peptidase/predicted Ser/Thr protein kinase
MSFPEGSRLGPYEILAPLGAGGMGEVYKARDTRLDRTVAVKVLSPSFAATADLRQRFEREARAISALTHPNVCTLYDVGLHEGTDYLVMEYLEGESLAQRLERGPLPLEQALRAGVEIAAALDRAHRAGIVHRDLKPGNVMLTRGGVKLLDFGLAKLQGAPPVSGLTVAAGLPTRDQPLTAEGTLLGTMPYMAPEQLEGREADPRTDLWALGAVLFEMLTGRRAFSGSSQASLIGAIMTSEPPAIATLVPISPPALDRVVRTCLRKDPDDRWQSAHDLGAELRWILEAGSQAGVAAPLSRRRVRRESLAWAVAALAGLGMIAAAVWALRRPAPAGGVVRLAVARSVTAPYEGFGEASISPDGRRIVFTAAGSGGTTQLWLRDLDRETPRPISGTDGGEQPFWSPDGKHLGFFARGQLLRIDVGGGPARVLCPAPGPRGGSWGSANVIAFSVLGPGTGVMQVPAEGGAPKAATKLAPTEEAHRWPSFLPDGRHFVFLGDAVHTEDHHLRVGSLDSTESLELSQAVSRPVWADPGYILYVRGGALLAQPFDQRALRFTGDPITIGENIAQTIENHGFEFSASPAGVLTYRSASPLSRTSWFDRSGKAVATFGEPRQIGDIALSPDGSHLAWMQRDSDGRPGDIWVRDLERGVETRLSPDPAGDYGPQWSPDGNEVVWSSYRSGGGDLYAASPFEAAAPRLLVGSPAEKAVESWGPGVLLFTVNQPDNQLWALPLTPPGEPHRLGTVAAEVSSAQLSRDGRWMVYMGRDSGRPEVYLQAYPPTERRWQVSTAGGVRPRWRADGREVFFVNLSGDLVAVDIQAGPSPTIGAAHTLFHLGAFEDWDAAPDGQRFLFVQRIEDQYLAPITVVLNWTRLVETPR